jgi:hypothetical protein
MHPLPYPNVRVIASFTISSMHERFTLYTLSPDVHENKIGRFTEGNKQMPDHPKNRTYIMLGVSMS